MGPRRSKVQKMDTGAETEYLGMYRLGNLIRLIFNANSQ